LLWQAGRLLLALTYQILTVTQEAEEHQFYTLNLAIDIEGTASLAQA
jgi:hypothetical protein